MTKERTNELTVERITDTLQERPDLLSLMKEAVSHATPEDTHGTPAEDGDLLFVRFCMDWLTNQKDHARPELDDLMDDLLRLEDSNEMKGKLRSFYSADDEAGD